MIESLERSVRLLQTRLALYEGEMRTLRQAVSRHDQEETPLSKPEERTTSGFSTPQNSGNELHSNSNSKGQALASTEEFAEPIITVRTKSVSSGTADTIASGQAEAQTHSRIDQSLTELKAQMTILSTTVVSQNEQIERLKTVVFP